MNVQPCCSRFQFPRRRRSLTAPPGTVGLDTGLSHIAAALGIPSVTIYGATDPRLVGATGKHQVHLASQFVCVRCHETECVYPGTERIQTSVPGGAHS